MVRILAIFVQDGEVKVKAQSKEIEANTESTFFLSVNAATLSYACLVHNIIPNCYFCLCF